MTDHTSREWLYEKYITEGLGCPEIGQIVGRDAKTIFYWLRKHSIPTRPRGTNYQKNLLRGQRKGWRPSKETVEKVRQATIRDGRVPYLRNGQHWLKTVPSEQNPNWKGGITPERQAFYRTEEWKEAEKAVWQRDNSTCQRCGKVHPGGNRRKFHVHHIVRFEVKELRAALSNLVLLCSKCHHFVHGRHNVNREFVGEVN